MQSPNRWTARVDSLIPLKRGPSKREVLCAGHHGQRGWLSQREPVNRSPGLNLHVVKKEFHS